jgi:pectinesterase
MKKCFWFLLLLLNCSEDVQSEKQPEAVKKNEFTIDASGSGDFKTVNEAIASVGNLAGQPITFHLKPGVYYEKVTIPAALTKVSLIGEDPITTTIVFDDYSGKGDINTFTSWTFKVLANDFRAENISFENSAGPVGQAVALHIESDRAVFKNCRFVGNQDTIFADGEKSRQYFQSCYIEGTTDFIFGSATAVFSDCLIHSKKESYVTAASTTQGKPFGYVFFNTKLTAASGINKVYLGRPWRNFAKTVYIDCELGAHIRPEGWHNWNKPEAEQTVLYAEYKSTGPGASPATRVAWSKQLTDEQRSAYTVAKILKGTDNWDPQ